MSDLKKIYQDPLSIRNIDNPTEEQCIVAVKKNGMVIKFIKNPTFTVIKEAIINNPLSVEYVEEVPEELGILAVKLLWNSIKYIEPLTDNIMKEAVNSKGWAIQFIKNPSEELQISAVNKDYDAIKYIKDPSEEVQLAAVKNYWGAIRFIDNPTLEVRRAAIIANEESINYIMNYDIDELKIFIGDNIKILKYLYESLEIELVIEVLTEKIGKSNIDKKYMRDFLELEILEMDKVNFVKEQGSKEAKKALVDYMLTF